MAHMSFKAKTLGNLRHAILELDEACTTPNVRDDAVAAFMFVGIYERAKEGDSDRLADVFSRYGMHITITP